MTLDELRRVPLFADLSEEDLERLYKMAETVSIQPGELVFEEGSPGDALYVILDGELEITKRQGGRDVVLAVRREGEFIGELSLLEQARAEPLLISLLILLFWRRGRSAGQVKPAEALRVGDRVDLYDLRAPYREAEYHKKPSTRSHDDSPPSLVFGQPEHPDVRATFLDGSTSRFGACANRLATFRVCRFSELSAWLSAVYRCIRYPPVREASRYPPK